ncbi:extracellular solute-binding protein [Paenibacillus frigoriresistens]|uniref:extracellular solute-binding protein n=1 Tax=Paenibacillus alginolyticus TaxID=59839 RepID=UPI00156516E7|nr:extracellular solute-binding protein [Paenibacillus frigoriresistens]NRF95615.1 extracellular solute-binding protein [Paenibacillus frigoriresistens]
MKNGALVFTVITALLAGCTGKESGTSSTSTLTPSATMGATATTTVKPAEAATLRLLTELSSAWPVKKDWAVWKWVKEKTNITINQETQTGPESLALAIASGDMPDLMSVFPPDAQKYGPQGAFLDLSKHLDKMPNLKSFLVSRPDVAQRMTSPGGEMYHVLNDGMGVGNQTVYFYRDDIFKKHSLQEPKTWDEVYINCKETKGAVP